MIDFISPLVNDKPKTKKTFRYKTVFKGQVISKHYTKAAATAASKKLRGSYVLKISDKIRKPKRKRITRAKGRR